jgi:leucyl-tRNA synthetase
MLKITAYAERLLNDLDGLDWPESLKEMQRNWIGRSEGASVKFKLEPRAETRKRGEELELDSNKLRGSASLREDYIEVFTTRPDTLFGATYLVLAPEHPLVNQITADSERASVSAYIKEISAKSDLERTDLAKTKTGCCTGAFAVNPVNGARIPVWIADYVLMSYGTGAIMAVPAHDERDFEFAQKFNLPVIEVVHPQITPINADDLLAKNSQKNLRESASSADKNCFTGEGIVINSGFLNGLPTSAAKQTITAWLVERGLGEARVQYKLRDWLFSRQRYWGEPFPVAWKDGNHFLLPDDALPVTLPELADYQPSKEGLAPLSKAKDWLALPDGAQRETNTMPQWGGSCWYYLRYCDPTNHTLPIGADADRYWLQPHGVDLYVGGAEHAVLHLLYARFWHKVLFDLGIVSTSEPFHKLVNQGLILGEDGQKMSKSLGNVVNPDDVVAAYGADALRLFEMFMGPLEQVKPWSTQGVEGVYRFLGRVWRLVMTENQAGDWLPNGTVSDTVPAPALLKSLHQCIKKVTADIEAMSFNTAIAALMVLTNDLTKSATHPRAIMEPFLQLLAPFAPHLAEELWQTLGHPDSLTRAPWPQFDEKYLIEDTLDLIIQVNGKLRAKLTISASLNVSDYEATVKQHADYEKWLGGKALKKCVTVPGKLVNLVVG